MLLSADIPSPVKTFLIVDNKIFTSSQCANHKPNL